MGPVLQEWQIDTYISCKPNGGHACFISEMPQILNGVYSITIKECNDENLGSLEKCKEIWDNFNDSIASFSL